MKKVLFIQQNLQGGGAEKVLVDILNNIDYNAYEISLLLIDGSGIYINQVDNRVKIFRLLEQKEIKLLGYLTQAKLFCIVNLYLRHKLEYLLKGKGYDTIVSFMEGTSAKCHSFISKKAKRNVSWVHTDLLLNNWCINQFGSLKKQRKAYECMDCIITVSDGAESSFRKLFPGLKTKVIYNIIDKNKIFEKAIISSFKPTKFTVCNVGRLAKQKRQDRIVEVASLCKENNLDIDFLILGEGPERNKLENMIQERGLTENVHLLGFQTNPYSFMGSCDVFLLTSDSEGYPLVICESLCLGKAIVSTDITGPHELLTGNTGILTTKEPKDIYNAIHRLYSNRENLAEYALASKRKSSIFDIESQMQSIYEIL